MSADTIFRVAQGLQLKEPSIQSFIIENKAVKGGTGTTSLVTGIGCEITITIQPSMPIDCPSIFTCTSKEISK